MTLPQTGVCKQVFSADRDIVCGSLYENIGGSGIKPGQFGADKEPLETARAKISKSMLG
jgi:hypothetical protein